MDTLPARRIPRGQFQDVTGTGQYRWGMIGLGLVWLVSIVLSVWPDTPTLADRQIVRFMLGAGLGSLIWWAAIRWNRDRPSDHLMVIWIVGSGLIARLFLLVVAPESSVLSDDVFRYLWDGRMIDLGINPFYFSPDEAILEPIRDSVFYPGINHPSLPTIYPPLAQGAFWLSYTLTPDSIMGFRIVSLLAEVTAWIACWWYLHVNRDSLNYLLVLVWCPLLVWEFHYSAHLDILALPLLIVALVFLSKDRPVPGAVALATAGCVKFFGWMFLPLCIWGQPWKTKWKVAGAATLTVAILYAPLMRAGADIIGSLPDYLTQWRFNGSVYQVLARLLDDPAWLRWVLGGLLALWILLAGRRFRTVPGRWLAIWTAYVVTATTLFPWYMLWALPALVRKRWTPILWLTAAVFLSYQYLIDYEDTGIWADYAWCTWVEYGVFYIVLLAGLWQWWRGRRRTPAPVVTT